MSQDDYKIKKLFQEKFEEASNETPPHIWESIEKEIFPKKKKSRALLILFVALFFCGTTLYLSIFLSTKSHSAIQVVSAKDFREESDSSEVLQNDVHGLLKTEESSASNDSVHPMAFLNSNSSLKAKSTRKNIKLSKNERDSRLLNNGLSYQMATMQNESTKTTPIDLISNHEYAISQDSVLSIHHEIGFKTSNEPIKTTIKDTVAFKLIPILPLNITRQEPNYSRKILSSLAIMKKHYLLLSSSFGRENRNYKFSSSSTASPNLVDREVNMKYRSLTLSYQNQLKQNWLLGIGVSVHRNRYITRLFPIKIANERLDDPYEFGASSGDLKSSPLNLSQFANPNQDTSVFLGRIIHRSAFVSLPITLRWSTYRASKVNYYLQAGFQFNFKLREKNTLIIRNSFFAREFESNVLRDRQVLSPSALFSVGIASPNEKRIHWFGELTFSQLLGNYYKSNNLSIRSNQTYLSFGIRFPLE
jgi:hypothetical protein